MSVLISSAIAELQQETLTVGERISDSDFILAFKRANKYFQATYKMPTTQRLHDLLLFPGVYEYGAPSDFGGWFEPQRPYGIHSPKFRSLPQNELVHNIDGRQMAFKFDRETQFLIVRETEGTSTLIHNLDDVDENGTWAISGDGASLVEDKQIFTEGAASLKFTLTGSGG